jgi:hypothetical protein
MKKKKRYKKDQTLYFNQPILATGTVQLSGWAMPLPGAFFHGDPALLVPPRPSFNQLWGKWVEVNMVEWHQEPKEFPKDVSYMRVWK